MTAARPVSAALARELRAKLRTAPRVWLDPDHRYTQFVDDLARAHRAGEFPYPVIAFRGSFLQVMLELKRFTSEPDPQPFLLHVPGFNWNTIRTTPLLEVYEAFANNYEKALDTLVLEAAAGLVRPDEVTTWLSEGRKTLEEADAWVASRVEPDRQGLAELLDRMGIDAVFGQLIAVLEGREREAILAPQVPNQQEAEVLTGFLSRHVGLSTQWVESYALGEQRVAPLMRVADTAIAWLLALEYVHDLRRAPYLSVLEPMVQVPKPYVEAATRLLDVLRKNHAETYIAIADGVEETLSSELRQMKPEDLGKIDTFRGEEVRVLEGAVDLLLQGHWADAREWCEARQGGRSFWLSQDQQRAWAWSLVHEAARFGETIATHPEPLVGATTHEDAVARYVEQAANVDRAHREFEQKRVARLDSRLPHFGALQRVVGDLRRRYRVWADDLALSFTALCEARGFLPARELQQRAVFDDVVAPLLDGGGRVALMTVDALRFEMGAALRQELEGPGLALRLEARLAELPTLTSVGMNVLAPVASGGKLRPVAEFRGFRTSEFIVSAPESRARAMGLRATGSTAVRLQLGDVVADPVEKLRQRIAAARLILVHGREIDDAGEAGVGAEAFDTLLRQVASAVNQLHAADVSAVVVTADHGFLLQDETTHVQRYGSPRDPERRHILADEPRREPGMVPVRLSELAYEGLDGYLLLRKDTAVYATSRTGANFVHGGNSLQERVIPILVSTRSRAEGVLHNELVIEVERAGRVLGCEHLRVRVQVAFGTPLALGFMGAATVQVGLRARGRADVSPVIRDTQGPGHLRTGSTVELPPGEKWTDVYVAVSGPRDERVQLEAFSLGGDRAEISLLEGWFEVEGRDVGAISVQRTEPAADWSNAIPDEGARRVFLHLHRHGSLSEPELIKMLGSARTARRFALEFDRYLTMLPFRVRVEPGVEGKRYVREEQGR
ncbi:MAG TPA: BREX-6 system phosphatase PglZ [Nannocystaceae bacterium]|nr:BREX-6 system phosphatase PglZ [Nannocystaceae bacterium]